jgi:hypothetical protein
MYDTLQLVRSCVSLTEHGLKRNIPIHTRAIGRRSEVFSPAFCKIYENY